jgi:ABC-type sugar transport system permease subunit
VSQLAERRTPTAIRGRQTGPSLPRRRRKLSSDTRAAYIFLAPAILGFTVFVLYPLFASGYYSLTSFTGLSDPVFIGFKNFIFLFTQDPSFVPSLEATGVLVGLYVPLSLIIGLGLALFANQRLRGVGIVRTLLYLPVVLPVVATVTLWKFVFDPQVGLANQILALFHLPPSLWTSSAATMMPSIVIVMLWGVGSTMIIFIAALQAVPTELYEAAKIDGAGAIKIFFRITLPLISPIIVLQVVLQMTTALQAFAQPNILSPANDQGGPGFSSDTLMLSIYNHAFAGLGSLPRLGYASAQVWVLFIIIVIAVAVTARFSSVWSYSDNES